MFRSMVIAAAAASAFAGQLPAAPRDLYPRAESNVDQDTNNYYLGYKGADYNTRWAKYFNDTPIEFNPDFAAGLAASPAPASSGVRFEDAAAVLSQPGYQELENGYTIMNDGVMYLAIQTYVPEEFTGEMYDFWFSWHTNDTTKYKLWFPEQHQYAAVDRSTIQEYATKGDYRSRYWGLTSYVDEYIGATPYKLSISFFDPSLLGFEADNCETGIETIVTGYVSVGIYNDIDPTLYAKTGLGPINTILAHQVRQRPDGKGMEIRSRFWFGPALVLAMRAAFDPLTLGRDLSIHCAKEMTHLGTFLPALFEEFRDDIPTANN